jgi:hypothetical protein
MDMQSIAKNWFALTKRLMSYTKREWNFHDYPIYTWKNPNAGEEKVAFGAGFVDWMGMVGHGVNAERAIAQLKEQFDLFKANNELSRPGTHVPLKFASTQKIDQYADIGRDFLYRIFGLNFDNGFYSDGSALEYFMPIGESPEEFKRQTIERVRKTYDVDIEDIYDKALWIVLKRLEENGVQKSTVRIGFFQNFKGADTLIFSGNQKGIDALRDILQEGTTKGAASINLHECPLFVSNVEVTLRSTKDAAGMKKISDKQFEWNLDPKKMTAFAEMIKGLGTTPAHQYLDCDAMDDVQVMVSSDEYPDELFKSN